MIVGIGGSGRKPSNSGRLLQEALEGARSQGLGPARTFDLSALSFRGCVGCGRCRSGEEDCVLRDDLTETLEATAAAEAVVLASPIYYGYTTGLFKSYLDRWYAFRDGTRALRTPPGRPALLLLTQGHPDPEAYSWTRHSLEKVLASYGFLPTILVGPSLEGREDASRHPGLLAQARAAGAELARAARAP